MKRERTGPSWGYEQTVLSGLESWFRTLGVPSSTFRIEASFGAWRPDLLVFIPKRGTFLLELKAGHGPAHFDWIATLATQAAAISRQLSDRREFWPVAEGGIQVVLATTRQISESIAATAAELGITIIPIPLQDPEQAAREIAERISGANLSSWDREVGPEFPESDT